MAGNFLVSRYRRVDPFGDENLERRWIQVAARELPQAERYHPVRRQHDGHSMLRLHKGRLLCAGRLDELLSARGVRISIPKEQEKIAQELTPVLRPAGQAERLWSAVIPGVPAALRQVS